MRRRFSCGHTGKGTYCHRCDQEQRERAARAAERAAANARKATLPVPVEGLPDAVVAQIEKAVKALAQGRDYRELRGKRLVASGQRDVLVIPLGHRYRLIGRFESAGLRFLEAISHETYNGRLAQGGWAGARGDHGK